MTSTDTGRHESPLVSIILTTLNSERFLARSIESCLSQSHEKLELIVVDGGSKDATLSIVDGYRDPRIRVVHQKHNAGKLPGALNLGMAEAKGDLITWTQDDCWYEPDAIRIMAEYLEDHEEIGLVYCDLWFVDEGGIPLQLSPAMDPELIADGGDIVGQCFLFRRQVYEEIGPQDVAYFPVHEVPWRIKVARRFQIRPLRVPLMYYTMHDASLTGRIGAWELQRMSARALLSEGIADRHWFRHRLAEIDIHESYEACVLKGDYTTLWRRAISGIWRVPGHLRNLGYFKLLLRSLLPGRETYRCRLLRAWQTKQEAILAEQIARFLPEGSKAT
jgi:glycosyltransferase involved in cell wall biosynthesis